MTYTSQIGLFVINYCFDFTLNKTFDYGTYLSWPEAIHLFCLIVVTIVTKYLLLYVFFNALNHNQFKLNDRLNC